MTLSMFQFSRALPQFFIRFQYGVLILWLWPDLACGAEITFPGKTWERRAPEQVGLTKAAVDRFADAVQGDGCVVRHGYLVGSWGDYTAQGDWASAGKPAISTLLMLALKQELVPSVDHQILASGWDLHLTDYRMTFRHLANMTSGYARGETPDAAWAYNDVAINLYVHSLKKLFTSGFEQAFSSHLGDLQFEDPPFFGSPDGIRVTASPRDFARLGWFWLQRGAWKGRQIIPLDLFEDCVRPTVATNLPVSKKEDADYLNVGTYGGTTNQTPHGPGIYGFTFWFNKMVPGKSYRVWPSLPADTFQANGNWNVYSVTMIPSWQMVVVVRKGRMGAFTPGDPDSRMDQRLRMLTPSKR